MAIDMFEILRDMDLPAPRGVLQVGASYGQELPVFQAHGVTSGVFVEPLEAPFQHLAQACKRIPGYVAVQTLCSEETGAKHTFHVASNHGMSSSLLRPNNHLSQFDYVKFDRTIEVVSNRLDDVVAFLAGQGYSGVVDALDTLYMDTQGAELRILRGAERVLSRIKYILTEVTRNELYEGAPTLTDLSMYLETAGFTLNNVYFNKEQCGDALFIRRQMLGLPH